MAKVNMVYAYECNSGLHLHADAYDAAYCNEPMSRPGWKCGIDDAACDAETGIHFTGEDAEKCVAARALETRNTCVCAHLKRHHAVANSFPGCYDVDCRCHAFEPDMEVAS